MESNAELVRLEQFVDTLLNKYNELKTRFYALEATLAERDAECEGLKNDIAGLQEQRSEVGDRVVGLLDRIEQWEAEQNEDGSEEDTDKQETLFENNDQENG
jgi:uncharacterized coiled-coil protein SlyX